MKFPATLSRLAPDTGGHRIARSLALRGLGAVYLVAFASWGVQAAALVGEDGLSPVAQLLDWLGPRLDAEGRSAFAALPTLFWMTGASDAALLLACAAGCLLALCATGGILAGPALAVLWFLYLSLVNTGASS